MILVNSAIDSDHRSNLVFECYLLPFYARNLVNLRFCRTFMARAVLIEIIQLNTKLF
jgi:hypothetical protein